MSIVEDTLRNQAQAWREIADRVAGISTRDIHPDAPERLLFFGVGSSHYAARLCAYTIIRDRTSTRRQVVACSSTGIGTEVIPRKGDWAFAFTHRGTSQQTLQALEMCERNGAITLQVSGRGAPESPSARYVLTTGEQEKVEPHTMAVTTAICAVTTLLMGRKVIEEWDALATLGSPDLDLMRKRAGEGPAALVGEWEGEWLAREGALKLAEMAKLPVRAYGSEEFYHGPRQALGEEGLWHVSTPKDPRNDEIRRPAHRIGIYGATPLAWVPALVELQWLALATALNRDVNPDGVGR
jgi:fructoselysine-6-P-deglycase FrlB-like protein